MDFYPWLVFVHIAGRKSGVAAEQAATRSVLLRQSPLRARDW